MRILARRIRFASFFQSQEEHLGAVASALATDVQIMTTVQRRSVWVRNRSQAFTEIISLHCLPYPAIFRTNETAMT